METNICEKLWKAFEIIAIGCVLFGALLVLYFVRGLLTPFIIAFVITFFVGPVVDYVEGEGINRAFALILLIILTLVFLLILWKLTWPTLRIEIINFQENAPLYLSKIQKNLTHAMEGIEKRAGFIPEGVLQKAIQDKMNPFILKSKDVGSLLSIAKEFVVSFILIQFVVFFFLKDGRKIKKGLVSYVPNKYFETFLTLIDEIDQQISNYIRGQLTVAFLVGVLAITGLYLFGTKYAIFIGTVAGITNMVPYIGPLLGIAFGSVLALIDTDSIISVFRVIGVLGAVKVLDSIVISPLVVSRSVSVHPLMALIVICVGGLLHGVWGMLLSVPLFCSLRVSLRILYRGFVEYGNW
jgi:predicted PurR-regulated permease PerM